MIRLVLNITVVLLSFVYLCEGALPCAEGTHHDHDNHCPELTQTTADHGSSGKETQQIPDTHQCSCPCHIPIIHTYNVAEPVMTVSQFFYPSLTCLYPRGIPSVPDHIPLA
jgi:hypothetical protein